jgi:hypothetical protein
MKLLLDKWKEIIRAANIKGIPIPFIKDPQSERASVSLTLVFISFNLCIVAMAGKWSGYFGTIDPSQALNLFMVCAGLYWGRKLNSKDEVITPEEKTASAVDHNKQS